MALSSRLAELIVQFVSNGTDALKASIAGVKAQTEQLKTTIDTMGKVAEHQLKSADILFAKAQYAIKSTQDAISKTAEKTKKSSAEMGNSASKVGLAFAVAFGAATATLAGFVRAGIQGTGVGQQLSFQMSQLSRTIAGLFGPELNKLTDAIRNLVNWMQSLSDAQLTSIANWTKGVLVVGAMILIIPKLVTAIRTVVVALKELAKAETIAKAFSGPGGWLAITASAAVAAAGVMALNAAFGDEEKPGGRRKMAEPIGGFEASDQAYRRIALASLIGGKSADAQQVDELKSANMKLDKIDASVRGVKIPIK